MNYEELYAAQAAFFDAPWLKGCSFANEWRNEWRRVLRAAARDPKPYPPQNPAAVFPMEHTFEDAEFTFHFDMEKVWDWFRRDSALKERRVFLPRELTRNLEGEVGIRDSQLTWDAALPEPELPDAGKELLVCSLPGFPPPLRVVSGNRLVDGSFTGFKKRKLPICLIQAEFTPAFLGDSFEAALYLFWMDVCIMMENRVKLKDKDLQPLLHIFRASSMLTIKGLK
ncbi:MAG: hypothetical protein ACLSE7_08010 [Lachnospirales bacterium]